MRKIFFGRGSDREAGHGDLPENEPDIAASEDAAMKEQDVSDDIAKASGDAGDIPGYPGDTADGADLVCEDAISESDIYATDETNCESVQAESTEQVLSQLREEAECNYDKYIRAVAELENYKKRVLKERAELIKYSGEYLARDLLDVVDNLERALDHAGSENAEDLIKGVSMVRDLFISVLERHNIVGVSSVGSAFDPAKQEAMVSVPTADSPPGVVLNELRKAYFFKDKLLRAAQVVVSASPSGSESKPDAVEEDTSESLK